jgi:hypothetical protein
MADVVPSPQQEFWRPPAPNAPATEPVAHLVEVCDHCEAEFLPDARFCHRCGTSRVDSLGAHGWNLVVDARRLVSHLEFQNIESTARRVRQYLALSPICLFSFGLGVFCLVAAIAVGMIFSPQTTLDWQAIQMWRIEWLLGSVACFVAGILLKRSA